MALVTRATDAHADAGSLAKSNTITGLYAGEDLVIGPVYVASDGTVKKSNGTAANAAAKVRGWVARAAKSGEPVTVFTSRGLRFRYAASGLAIGADFYLATTAGGLDTATTTGGTTAIAYAISATDIVTL